MDIEFITGKSSKASVKFESPLERYTFGENAPFFSAEHLRSKAWDAQAFWSLAMPPVMYWHREFPQTAEVSHTVIGHVASVLAEKAEPVEGTGITVTEADVLTATRSHVRELLVSSRSVTSS